MPRLSLAPALNVQAGQTAEGDGSAQLLSSSAHSFGVQAAEVAASKSSLALETARERVEALQSDKLLLETEQFRKEKAWEVSFSVDASVWLRSPASCVGIAGIDAKAQRGPRREDLHHERGHDSASQGDRRQQGDSS